MKNFIFKLIIFIFFSSSIFALALPEPTNKKNPKKSTMNFEDQLVEGQIYRPEFSVVTGDLSNQGNGVLRLRTNFSDRMDEDTLKADQQ